MTNPNALSQAQEHATTAAGCKRRAADAVEQARAALLDFSHRLNANPELGLEEVKASAWLAGELRQVPGARVQHGVGALPTAVRADAGTGELVVTICAEYDALAGLGHACGHNVIAAAALGAFTALAPLAEDLGMTVRLLGTPAEETWGGKILMLDAGDFDGTHAAMMVHPADVECVEMRPYASQGFTVEYTGRAAHASIQPWAGINAADALTVAQTAIGLARQQLEPNQQIHGFAEAVGTAPNVIPDKAVAHYIVRADSMDSLARVDAVMRRCLEAGAVASGASLTVTPEGPAFASMVSHPAMTRFYEANGLALGRAFTPPALGGSTDMGNVSQRFPTIHPMISLGPDAPTMHHPDFAACAVTDAGDQAVLDGATAMAWTAIDLALDPGVRAELLAGA